VSVALLSGSLKFIQPEPRRSFPFAGPVDDLVFEEVDDTGE